MNVDGLNMKIVKIELDKSIDQMLKRIDNLSNAISCSESAYELIKTSIRIFEEVLLPYKDTPSLRIDLKNYLKNLKEAKANINKDSGVLHLEVQNEGRELKKLYDRKDELNKG